MHVVLTLTLFEYSHFKGEAGDANCCVGCMMTLQLITAADTLNTVKQMFNLSERGLLRYTFLSTSRSFTKKLQKHPN